MAAGETRGAVGLYRRFFRRLGHMRWFAVLGRYVFPRVDRLMFRVTGGRLFPTGTVAPVLILTTTGRRTGQPRTTPVIYIRDDEKFVITSQDLGNESRRAAWPLNLDADPRALVKLGSETIPCRARRLDDLEAAHYWPRLVEVWPAHETYLERSGRRHTFVLEPVATENVPPHRRERELDMTRGRTGPQIIRGPETENADLALRSLDVLAATNAKTVLPGHGEPWPHGVKSAVDLARKTG